MASFGGDPVDLVFGVLGWRTGRSRSRPVTEVRMVRTRAPSFRAHATTLHAIDPAKSSTRSRPKQGDRALHPIPAGLNRTERWCSAPRVHGALDPAGMLVGSAGSSMDRASDYGSEGWGFDSLPARQQGKRHEVSNYHVAEGQSLGDLVEPA